MATAGTSSAAILEPSTLPQVSFARADDLLNHAAQLRTNAEILKARAKETEDNAKQLEDSAAELQASAETLREYIQAKLDTTLEHHGDVLKQFLLTPANEEELKTLRISVEEGRSDVQQVTNFGEQLLQFRSANLKSSHPSGGSSCELSRDENSAASSTQISFPNWALPHAPSAPVGRASWRYRINSLLGRRVADVDRPSSFLPVSSETRESSVEAHKEINASNDKDETRGDQDHETSNTVDAPTNQSDIPAGSVSCEVLQNAIVPGTDEDTTIATKIKHQTRHMKKIRAEGNIISSQDIHQSYVEEDFIPLNPPNSSASRKVKRKSASLALSAPDTKRRKKEKELRTTVFNEREALARYRKLFVNGKGPNEDKAGTAKKMLKKQFKSEIERHDEMSSKEKNQWIAYTMQQINAMVKREHDGDNGKNKAVMTRREHESDDNDDSMVRREGECVANAEQAECCAAELSEESANESMWP